MLLSIPDILLVATAIANLGALWFVHQREGENPVYRLFSLFIAGIAFWAIVILLFRMVSSETIALYLMKGSYISALFLALSFYRFAILFPHASGRPPPRSSKVLNAFITTLVGYILLPDVLTQGIVFHDWGKEVLLQPFAYYLFAITFLFLFCGALARLVYKIFLHSGRERIQLTVISGVVGVIGVFGMYYNLVLPSPFMQDFRYIWTGPVFTFIFAVAMLVVIFRYQFFNPRAVMAELLVYILLFFLFVRLLLTDSLSEQIINSGLLVIVTLVGVLLIKSVHREIEQREKIQELASDLEAANRRQEGLIHFISHEVKGALGKCAGMLSLIIDGDYGPAPDKLHDAAGRGLSDTRAAVDMVSTILLSSNLKSGKMNFNMQLLNFLEDVVRPAFEGLKEDAERKGLHITLKEDIPDTCAIVGDKDMLAHHVVRNLIDNAIKYTPMGDVIVGIRCINGKMVLSVTDSGVGITPVDMEHLFTEGGRGKDSIKVNVNSTGYGLYFAKQLVDAHGGTIRAESDGSGKGSTFIVELPLAKNP